MRFNVVYCTVIQYTLITEHSIFRNLKNVLQYFRQNFDERIFFAQNVSENLPKFSGERKIQGTLIILLQWNFTMKILELSIDHSIFVHFSVIFTSISEIHVFHKIPKNERKIRLNLGKSRECYNAINITMIEVIRLPSN